LPCGVAVELRTWRHSWRRGNSHSSCLPVVGPTFRTYATRDAQTPARCRFCLPCRRGVCPPLALPGRLTFHLPAPRLCGRTAAHARARLTRPRPLPPPHFADTSSPAHAAPQPPLPPQLPPPPPVWELFVDTLRGHTGHSRRATAALLPDVCCLLAIQDSAGGSDLT